MGDHPQTTLVMLHDLLGFGSLVSNAGGRFDSKVGEIAFDRIVLLKETLNNTKKDFPKGTRCFHFNDSVVALLDVEMVLSSDHHGTSGSIQGSDTAYWKIFKFIGAASKLHDAIRNAENDQEIGPAGRTILSLGHRWKLPERLVTDKDDIGMLSANLAFAEAYHADEQGFKPKGFQKNNANIYINEELYQNLSIVSQVSQYILEPDTCKDFQSKYEEFKKFGPILKKFDDGDFPKNICAYEDVGNFEFELFHKKRRFTALDSLKALELTNLFDSEFI